MYIYTCTGMHMYMHLCVIFTSIIVLHITCSVYGSSYVYFNRINNTYTFIAFIGVMKSKIRRVYWVEERTQYSYY